MVKGTFAIALTLACFMTGMAQDQAPAPQPPLLTFSDLKRGDIEGPFRIAGFVVDSYKCPPCPRGAMCKPCIGDHVVITDNLDENNPALIKRLWVFTDKPEQLELKKKYSFVVKVRGSLRPGHPIEQVELVRFEPLNADQIAAEIQHKSPTPALATEGFIK